MRVACSWSATPRWSGGSPSCRTCSIRATCSWSTTPGSFPPGCGPVGRPAAGSRSCWSSARTKPNGGVCCVRDGGWTGAPYIERPASPEDRERYQTVYARQPGAVAAPTAGLHFTPAILEALDRRGIGLAGITLHVGPGTFRPVKTDDPDTHIMDSELFDVPAATAEAIADTRGRGGKVVAAGTTVVRTLETVASGGGLVAARAGRTELFIRPGYEFQVTDRLITNFHLPRSTLLMLVCAFAGRNRTLDAYRQATASGFRFYSYGDAMLVSRSQRMR